MTNPLDLAELSVRSQTWIPILIELSLRGTLILASAFLIAAACRRAPAAFRHVVWSAALGGMLALPLLSSSVPPLVVPGISSLVANRGERGSSVPTGPRLAIAEEAPPVSPSPILSPRASIELPGNRKFPPPPVTSGHQNRDAAAFSANGTVIDWSILAMALWMAGVISITARLLLGMLRVRSIARKARPLREPIWTDHAAGLAASLGVKQRVALLESERVAMPVASGWFRPIIMVPAAAADWAEDRRHVVLLHELAHVKRRDCITQTLAQLSCAIYWFNPLVWLAARQLRAERERACDDCVLGNGTRASEYAAHLLELARSLGSGRSSSFGAVAIARRSQLEGRLLAILDQRPKRARLTRTASFLAMIAVALIVVPVAAIQPAAQTDQPLTPTQPTKPEHEFESLSVASVKSASPVNEATPESGNVIEPDEAAVSEPPIDPVEAEPVDDSVEAMPVSEQDAETAQDAAPAETSRAAAALREALRDEDREVRLHALDALVKIHDSTAIQALIEASKDGDWQMRKHVVWVMGSRKVPGVVEILIRALGDEHHEVREQAAWALAHHRDARSIEPLIAAMKDPSADVREQSVWALGHVGDNRAVEPLIAALKDEKPQVREQAAWALAHKGDKRAIEPLIAALSDPNRQVRERAVWALGVRGDSGAVEPLIGALKDENAHVREQAAWALGRRGDARATEPLIPALKDANANVREQAAWALGRIGDPRAIDALSEALKDASRQVRQQAAWALGRMLAKQST